MADRVPFFSRFFSLAGIFHLLLRFSLFLRAINFGARGFKIIFPQGNLFVPSQKFSLAFSLVPPPKNMPPSLRPDPSGFFVFFFIAEFFPLSFG